VNRFIIVTAAIGLSIAVLSGCKHDIQSTEAVKKGVLAYLSKRSDLLAMDVNITNVAYQKDEATATVHFQAKGITTPGSGMDMRYVLERKGSDWVVKGRAGGDAHGAQGLGAPPSAPPDGSIGAMPQTLPPGHPGVTPQTLPPGHPAISPKKTGPPK